MNYKHGATILSPEARETPEYRAWRMMKARCSRKRAPKYHRYGGRGIKVCARWQNNFSAFLSDMGPRPSPRHSLDRKNNDRDYKPSNCRWATVIEQQRNRSDTKFIRVNGRRVKFADAVAESGFSYDVVKHRLRLGWSVRDALTRPKFWRNK